MKKLSLVLFILSITTLSVVASQLDLRIYNNSDFYVVLDGVTYNTNKNFFTIGNITPGNHQLKVVSYINGKYKRYNETIFNSNIHIPANSRVVAVIDQYAKFKIIENHPFSNNNPKIAVNGYYSGKSTYNDGHYASNAYYSGRTVRIMSEYDFNELKHLIRRLSFDKTKYDMAIAALDRNMFSSYQILEIMNMFSFESTKLNFAKNAYFKTVDPERYFVVNKAFSFDSSIRELNRFLSKY